MFQRCSSIFAGSVSHLGGHIDSIIMQLNYKLGWVNNIFHQLEGMISLFLHLQNFTWKAQRSVDS